MHEPYGGPEGLKRFVDACHARGLGVVMDAVYNHLGPAGNYLPEFGPYLTDAHTTPWGSAVNLDMPGSDEVRRYVIDSALGWLRDYHVDGLRLDAVHALVDERATHLLEELAVEVDALGAQLRKPLWLVAESDLNDARLVTSREAGGYGLDGQWADDVHHACTRRSPASGRGYYGDFGSLPTLAKALHRGLRARRHAGRASAGAHTAGRCRRRSPARGSWCTCRTTTRSATGPPATGSPRRCRTACSRSAPRWCSPPRSPHAVDGRGVGRAHALAVLLRPRRRARRGREQGPPGRVRHARLGHRGGAGPAGRVDLPGVQLDWSEREGEREQALLAWTRDLLALRRQPPELTDGRRDRVEVTYDEEARWVVVRRGPVVVACNLSGERRRVPLPGTPRRRSCWRAPPASSSPTASSRPTASRRSSLELADR